MNVQRHKGAFTLIEVLVVIAIMAILTAVVYSSFNTAKVQSGDQKKISDISNIQLALEVYFNQTSPHQYPTSLDLLVPKYTPSIPKGDYNYFPIGNTAGSPICISYHLYTKLEKTSSYLDSRKSFDSTTANDCKLNPGDPAHISINASLPANNLVYDVMP